MTQRYTVTVGNNDGETKDVATCGYKQDAIAIAQRFVEATVTRQGRNGGREVYAHSHSVKDVAGSMFTLAGAKLVS
jgi:hypothetical protein